MSVIDKVVAAVTPPESEEARQEARSRAHAAAGSGDWLSLVLKHHVQIEAAFAAVKASRKAAERMQAQKRLGILLTGHSNAEESVLYPALTRAGEKSHAAMAYTEQAAAKTQMAELEMLAPMSQDYLDKLEHIRGAVAHHVYEEESKWFLELKNQIPEADQAKLTERYQEEFERYVGEDAPVDGAVPLAPSNRPHTSAPSHRHS
jgi:hemerythrin superfamily protein